MLPDTSKTSELIYEFCEKLNLDEMVKRPIAYFYKNILNKIGTKSSYNRKYIMIYAIYTISIKFNIYIYL